MWADFARLCAKISAIIPPTLPPQGAIMKLLQRIFRIWDYKNASLKRRILGLFPLVKKDNVLTLLVFGLPLIQRKRYVSVVANGGGGGTPK